jgi:predicted amidohydrolase
MNIALVSFNPKKQNSSDDFNSVRKVLEYCQRYQTDLCIFPETTFSGFNFPNVHSAENLEDSPSLKFFTAEALRLNISIIFGMFVRNQSSEHIYNSALVVDKSGKLTSRYDKIHLFSQAGETDFNREGGATQTVSIGDASFGLSICYDLRFPELFTSISKDCHALVNISNWPSKREKHWDALLRARAIENQSFVFGVNRSGFDDQGNFFKGDSKVYGPWGDLVKPRHNLEEERVQLYEIDFSHVSEVRESFPILADRRFRSLLVNSTKIVKRNGGMIV